MPANATALVATNTLPPITNKVVLERLVDDLDELDSLAWNGQDLDRLRELAGEAMLLASTLLDDV